MTRSRRDCATLLAVLLTGIPCCAVAPARASTGTGGAVMPEVIAPSTGGMGYGDPGTRSLVAGPALLGKRINVRGTMPGATNRRVILQRFDKRRGWRDVARTRVRSSDRFLFKWRPDRSGVVSLRAVIAPEPRRARARSRGRAAAVERAARRAAPVVAVTVYRPALATFYGPGFFGQQTACGQILTPDLQGVAHRHLPCGTLVLIMFHGRETTVPVIDRGPFNGAYDWDLTQATADSLGFQAGGIGYARVKQTQAPAPASAG
jgi:rare lipoprotein A (peptidoglycan hydrolase)